MVTVSIDELSPASADADQPLNGSGRASKAPLPTLEMVAAEAGVSRSTVSRVVNGSPKVRPDVVSAVNDAISRLNYVPNRAARSLASAQTYAIALVVPEDVTRFFGDPYFASVVKGITSRLDATEYILNLLVASSDPSGKTRRYLLGGNVDGALVVSHHVGDSDLAQLNKTLPVVFGGRPSAPQLLDSYSVDVDNVTGAVLATEHLIRLGRRHLGTITGPPDMPAAIDRLSGWRQALRKRALPDDAVEHGDFTVHSGAAAMRRLLRRHPALDAVFVANDLMAAGALTTLAEHGISVPGDIAVVGYDDSPAATSGPIQLTTVSQPSQLMGERMADMLLTILSGREPEQRTWLMPTQLVVRDSA